jgi:hypothetical protein
MLRPATGALPQISHTLDILDQLHLLRILIRLNTADFQKPEYYTTYSSFNQDNSWRFGDQAARIALNCQIDVGIVVLHRKKI